MPEQKIIITLSNSESDPENIQMHFGVENEASPVSEAEQLLHDSAANMCELFIQAIKAEGAENILDIPAAGQA